MSHLPLGEFPVAQTFKSAAAASQASPVVAFSAHKGPIYALEFVSANQFVTYVRWCLAFVSSIIVPSQRR